MDMHRVCWVGRVNRAAAAIGSPLLLFGTQSAKVGVKGAHADGCGEGRYFVWEMLIWLIWLQFRLFQGCPNFRCKGIANQ